MTVTLCHTRCWLNSLWEDYNGIWALHIPISLTMLYEEDILANHLFTGSIWRSNNTRIAKWWTQRRRKPIVGYLPHDLELPPKHSSWASFILYQHRYAPSLYQILFHTTRYPSSTFCTLGCPRRSILHRHVQTLPIKDGSLKRLVQFMLLIQDQYEHSGNKAFTARVV